MRFRSAGFAATLAATSSAFDFGGENDVTQTAGTVAPDQGTASLTPTSGVNGFGNFGMTAQLTPSSGESADIGNQGWPQQQGWSSGPATGWTPPSNSQGNQWGPQLGWPSNPIGGEGGQTIGGDCSGSSDGAWTPPSGGQGWETLGVDCSSSNEGGRIPSSGGWGDQGLGLECSGSSEGAGTPPSGGQGWGTQSTDCSEATGFSMAGSSAVEGSQETAGSLPAGSTNTEPSITGSATTEFSAASSASTEATTSMASSGTGTHDSLTPSTGGSSSAVLSSESLPSSASGDQGWSQAAQTSPTIASSSLATSSGSGVGADADQGQSSKLRSSGTARSSSSSETTQQQEQQEQQQQDDSSVAYTDTSGSDAIAYTSVWGSPIVAETSSNRSSAVPTFGDVTSKTGECVTGNPNEYISNEYLDWVWEHRIGPKADLSNESNWNVMANKNWIMDKLVHNNGSMNYCVRWDTDNQLSKDVASKFEGVLTRHYNAWNKWLEGYNCWPFTEIKVNMVGWAAKDLSQFEWKDNSLGSFYEGVLDPTDGVPMCPNECYRFYDNVNNVWSDTSACKGEPFDVSFWLKEDIPYGFGYDWGQELSLNNTLQNLYDKDIMFVGHEIGHGFGLPDFYDLTQKPSKDFPPSIMMAYSSITIAPSDGWMLRRVLDNVKSRYKF